MPVTEPSRAVFPSYASQKAWAAQRICESLRGSGIEVWFEQSELRGGIRGIRNGASARSSVRIVGCQLSCIRGARSNGG
jgi:hypothetical protein